MVVTSSGKEIIWTDDSRGRAGRQKGRKPNIRTTRKRNTRQNAKKNPQVVPQVEEIPTPVAPLVTVTQDVSRLRTSTEKPTCCQYGPDRQLKFPGYFFCPNCSNWDNCYFCPTSKNQRTSTRNACAANHTSWVYPTDKKLIPLVSHRTNTIRTISDNNSIRKCANTSTSNTNNNTLVNSDNDKKRAHTDSCVDTDSGDTDSEDSLLESEEKVNCSTNTNNNIGYFQQQFQNELDGIKKQLYDVCKQNESLEESNKYLQNEIQKSINKKIIVNSPESGNCSNSEIIDILLEEKNELKIKLSDSVKKNQQFTTVINLMSKKIELIEEKMALMPSNSPTKKNKKNNKKKKTENGTNYNKLSIEDIVTRFVTDIQQLSKTRKRNVKKMLDKVTKMLFDSAIFDGLMVKSFVSRAQEYYRTNIFSPQNLLKLMDINGGQLSMSSIDLLRTLDTEGIKYCHQSILPSTASIQRAAEVVDKVAKELVPFKESVLEDGSEVCEFNVPAVIALMIKAFGLEGASKKRRIRINQASDGAKLTNNLHHTTFGVKMIDYGARDPHTKQLIYGSKNASTIQSRDYCFPLNIIMAKETNGIMDQFRDCIQEVKNLTEEEYSRKHLNGAGPIESYFNADLSAQWKLLQKGYGVKRGDGHPCHICATQDRIIHNPNAVKCSRWCQELHSNKPEWKCFHTDFLDEKKVEEMRQELRGVEEELQTILSDFEDIQRQSFLNNKEDPRAPIVEQQLEDIQSIHLDITNKKIPKNTLLQYNESVLHDLKLRGLFNYGTLKENQIQLKQQMVQEYNYARLKESIKHGEGSDKSFILLSDCTPCILHMEMRTILKFLSLILNQGLKH